LCLAAPLGVRGQRASPVQPSARQPLSLPEAYDLYQQHLERADRSPLTRISWRTRFQVFMEWCREQRIETVSQVRTEDLETFLAELRTRPTAQGGAGYAPQTIEGYHRMLRALFNYLSKRRYLAANPAELVEKPRLPQKEHAILLPEDVARLLAACEGRSNRLRNRAEILFLWDLGCRFSEMAQLTLDDVDWATGVVRFRAETTKTDAERINRLSAEALDALRAYVEQERPAPDRRARTWQEWVFLSESGRRLNSDASNCQLQRLAKKAGLQVHVTHHLFRHSHVTVRLAFSLASGELVSYDVGHRSRATTARYTHLAEAFKRSGFHESGLADLVAGARTAGRPKKPRQTPGRQRLVLPPVQR
jgi:integrase/recombinase XerD